MIEEARKWKAATSRRKRPPNSEKDITKRQALLL